MALLTHRHCIFFCVRYDGAHDGIIVFDSHVAFARDLLATVQSEVMLGPDSYYRRWMAALHTYHRSFRMPIPAVQALFNTRRQFQLAAMDFEVLQHLDYASAFVCNCGGKRILLDGIALQMQSVKNFMMQPQVADAAKREGTVRPVFRDIVFIPAKRERELGQR